MFTTSRLVEGLYAGHHASLHHGTGVEFHDYRPYCPGDDPSKIDWKLYGRSDRYYLRRARQFSDLQVNVLLDCTASMDFAGADAGDHSSAPPPTKFAYAATLAAAIAFLTIRQGDRVGIGLFDQKITAHLPSGGTWDHLKKICALIEKAQPHSGPGDLSASLAQAHALMPKRGLVVLISDLLDESTKLFDGLSRFRHDRFDVIVFQVLTADEMDLSRVGSGPIKMVDAETHGSIGINLPVARQEYNRLVSRHLEIIRNGCIGRGIDYNLVTTAQPPIESLRKYLVRRTAIERS